MLIYKPFIATFRALKIPFNLYDKVKLFNHF